MLRTTVRTRPCEGETENGDRAVVRSEGDVWLAVMIDALGHGPAAARVADVAERRLAEVELAFGLPSILEDLHAALRGSRGAAVTAVFVRGTKIEAGGIGNVAFRAHGIPFAMAPSPGIVGTRVRAFKTFQGELRSGARLVLHTDGVSGRFDLADVGQLGTEAAADVLFERLARNHDDATLLVADRS